MGEIKKFSLLKPTIRTPFHIDFDWWKANDNNWHIALQEMLCPEHQAQLSSLPEDHVIDWIDPDTAEIHPMDGVQTTLINHCAQQPGFLDPHTILVEAILRLLLASGNKPVTPAELGERLGRSSEVILKTISGPQVYKGIRPYNPL